MQLLMLNLLLVHLLAKLNYPFMGLDLNNLMEKLLLDFLELKFLKTVKLSSSKKKISLNAKHPISKASVPKNAKSESNSENMI